MAQTKPKKTIALSAIKRILQGSVPDGGMVGKSVGLALKGGAAGKHQVFVPDGTDAYSGTIRSHEGRHLTFSPIGEVSTVPHEWLRHPLMMECVQMAEDAYVETRPLPDSTPASYRRMHAAAAQRDLQALAAMDPADPDTLKTKILLGTRVDAMQRAYGREDSDAEGLDALFPNRFLRFTVQKAVMHAMRGDRQEAALMLFRMLGGKLEDLEPDPPESSTAKVEDQGEGAAEGEKVPGDARGAEEAEKRINGKPSVMEIVDLPRTVPTKPDREKVYRTVYPDAGSRLNTSRLVNAVVSGDARGVFIQSLTEPMGESTLLIDASGSMHIDAKVLQRFCRDAPNATVAFYCGTDNTEDPKGWLNVYAMKGKRHDGPCKIQMGGNSVDLPALQWAAKQRGPITLVSDLGFRGCSEGEIAEAHGLVERLKQQGRLTIVNSIDEWSATVGAGRKKA